MSLGFDRASPDPLEYTIAHAHAMSSLPANMPVLPRYQGVVAVVLANKSSLAMPGSDPVHLRDELSSFLWVCNPLRTPPAPGLRRRRVR